ncbi:thymidylate kinase [Clostridium sp.]|uniref:thymidylate kinase n=1 Tax=Clostridium sp. TaxID=1506 RepID=UPI002842486D|nr:thymidylate kinase [Clostridium sp.]MDR3593598.1 thymidylate kinase [Clostridium sp.]
MKNRLILVEGIPGSGKTTISKKIKNYLVNKGLDVVLYNEGDVHPADMAWNALLNKEEFDNIINENRGHEQVIKENSIFEDDYVILAYTKLGFRRKQNKLMDFLEEHEIYDGRVSADVFKQIHLKRWRKFGEIMKENKERIVIFECSFLQNHVNELLAMHDKDLNYIKEYLNELIETVTELNPKLIYLNQLSIKETINRVAKERISHNKEMYPDWVDMCIEYFENSSYGKRNNINGFDGVIKYFEKRQEIELDVIKSLSLDKLIIYNKNYDYQNIENTIINNL